MEALVGGTALLFFLLLLLFLLVGAFLLKLLKFGDVFLAVVAEAALLKGEVREVLGQYLERSGKIHLGKWEEAQGRIALDTGT